MFAGHEITGGVLSSTVMTCAHVLLLPHPSDAVQILVMVYSCGQDPSVMIFENVTSGEALQLSEAVAEPVFTGKVLAVH